MITGGTSGIGLALAEAFAARGASVAVCARSRAGLEAFRATHPDLLAVEADVTDTASQTALLDAVEQRYGRIDVLVSNAGLLIERDFTIAPPTAAELADEFALNLVAPVQLTASTLSRWPRLDAIVLVSSGYALVSPKRSPTYGAAKAGLHGFAEGLRRQLASRGTHVLEVLPPTVDTRATAHLQVSKVKPDMVAAATLDALAKKRPMALVGQTRMLPALLRLAPNAIGRMVGQT
nr:SDR family NAD(P)-dependent oxidoreductase [Sphingomonas liriopis]